MKNIVLFDLDGTLTDSSEGIVNSVRYMLEKRVWRFLMRLRCIVSSDRR